MRAAELVRRPGPRGGSERCENEAGGLFQHPATLSWRFPPRQAKQGLARTIHQCSCGWDGSWHNGRWQCYAYFNLVGVNESAPGASVLSRR